MYVRWQSRKRDIYWSSFAKDYEDMAWRAILVENVRVDGKPRQRHIAYLAGWTESAIAVPAQRRYVWERIEARLESLGSRVSPDDRAAIIKAVAAKIGKPPKPLTKAQRAKRDREREANIEAVKTALAHARKT